MPRAYCPSVLYCTVESTLFCSGCCCTAVLLWITVRFGRGLDFLLRGKHGCTAKYCTGYCSSKHGVPNRAAKPHLTCTILSFFAGLHGTARFLRRCRSFVGCCCCCCCCLLLAVAAFHALIADMTTVGNGASTKLGPKPPFATG
jgi:hypothetical protein